MAKYKFGNENVVIVDYQGHSKLVNSRATWRSTTPAGRCTASRPS